LSQKNSFRNLIPREHGAWAMLGTAFIAGLVLARGVTWLTLVAAGAVVAAFLIRDSLVVIGRQRFVWRQPKPETAVARRFASALAVVLAACGAMLALARPWAVIAAFGMGAAALTALATFMTVRNRQRSPWMQMAVAIGLNASALAAWISVRPEIDRTVLWLWALLSANSIAGVETVHARLDARQALRTKDSHAVMVSRRNALIAIAALLAAGCAAVTWERWLIAPVIVAAAFYLWDLWKQRGAQELAVPLRRVGLIAMSFSIAYAAAVVALLMRG
jgi:4-hydroxybenzoate polyprenyltransferase